MKSPNSDPAWLRARILLLLLLVSGCTSNPLTPEQQSLRYFPLQVGNTWTYALPHDSTFHWTFTIVDTARIGGQNYFVFERRFNASGTPDSIYYRTNGKSIIYERFAGKEKVLVDFTKPLNKQVESGGGFYTLVKRFFTKTVPAGKFEDCIQVAFDPFPNAIDDEHAHVYAPDIGLIEISGQIGSMQLLTAVVNGTRVSQPGF